MIYPELKPPPQWQVDEASDFCRDTRVVPEDEALSHLAFAQQAIAHLEAERDALKAEKQEMALQALSDDGQWMEKTGALIAERDAARAELAALRERVEVVTQCALVVIKRWDSPLWRQEIGTATFINELRAAIDATSGED